jgi:hypothetical protein
VSTAVEEIPPTKCPVKVQKTGRIKMKKRRNYMRLEM